ncbi:craniofacial development protein 1 [Periplaneta americana]|uniref:craniofacial development protein 1 n=1 Tax=Periplaneta americana TaxID=6978 RepID=UPI0037E7B9F7
MDERELTSDSDESDEDYVPSGAESNPPSEEESDGVEEENDQDGSDDEDVDTRKRKRKNIKGKKKKKIKSGRKRSHQSEVQETEVEEKNEEEKILTEEEEKKKADSLWSDFLKDTGGSINRPKPAMTNGNKKEDPPEVKAESQKTVQKENKVTITKLFEFAGEEVRVTKEVASDSAEARLSTNPAAPAISQGAARGRGRGSGGLKGLSSVLGQLGKKSKLGTLEKSKLDWDRYKKDEGIEEELQKYNKGRDGYLEKQDFLERTDFRQFEIEKEMRSSRRSNR